MERTKTLCTVLIEPCKLPITKGSRNRENYANGESSNSILDTFQTVIVYDKKCAITEIFMKTSTT